MGKIKNDIPDITVVITKGDEYLSSVTPSDVYQVVVNTGDNYNVNVDEPDVITTNGSGSYITVADYATYSLTSSFAQTASYISGSINDWDFIINKPTGLVSSSAQATSWTVATASYAANATLPTGVVSSSTQVKTLLPSGTVSSSVQINTGSFSGTITSASFALTASYVSGAASTWDEVSQKPAGLVSSSKQIQLNQITGTTFSSSNFTFPQNLTVNGGLDVLGDIWVTPGVVNQLTSSYAIKAENIGVIDAGIYLTGSEPPVSPTTGITIVTSASYALTSSYSLNGGVSSSYALTASYALNGGNGGTLSSSLFSVDAYYFSGDGVTTDYILGKEYSSDSLIVTVGGVTFITPNDYSLVANTISFFEPPYSGSNIFVRGFVNVTQGATGSFYGSLTGIATHAITASYLSEVRLANTAPLIPTPGSVYFSGSFLYVYDGVQYKSASLN